MTRAEVIVVDAGLYGVTAARVRAEARNPGQWTGSRGGAGRW